MNILSSAALPNKNQKQLIDSFPKDNFVFCRSMKEAKENLPGADIIITYGEDLNSQVLEQALHLQWIMVIAAGIDKLPFDELNQRNILVTSAKGIHKAPMSEYVFFMLMLVYRQGKQLIENEKNRIWTRDIYMDEITGRTMMIAGTGVIGQEIAKVARAFQIKTIGVSRSGKKMDGFDENITHSQMTDRLCDVDFLISVLPSTSETDNFFNYTHFTQLPEHAVFINMGRGNVVQEEDILKAVREEEIGHAVLDVFENEPLPPEHVFWEEERITVTTHLSGVSPYYHDRAIDIFIQNLMRYKNNQHLMNKVDVAKGY
ncbi:D-2-hydroxyacid dehydrogenase [Salibacterium aidingense]|uniref:D-2-hydroxyacid dehydrogenase n=1 Tax=Salibacterium aidingense TaxID=384933 RepID=UPI003BD242E6